MPNTHVLIAGAGLAGLSAAHVLAGAGVAITMIEARDHLGGRVRTVRDFEGGQHAELGGEFIDAEHRAIIKLCRTFELPLVQVLRGGFTHRFRGSHGTFQLGRTSPWDVLAESLEPLIRRFKAAGGKRSAPSVREISTISLREWLRRHAASAELHAMADALRGFFLADPEQLSVLPVIEQIVGGGSPSRVTHFRISGGNDRLVDALMSATAFHRAAPARLLLSHCVRRVTQLSDRVVVSVDDASGGSHEIDADYLVMTLPASLLREVAMEPALPEPQERAIRSLPYGCATKVLLQTSGSLFGSRRARAFGTDTRLGAFWDASEEQQGSRSIVAFLAGGSASDALRDAAAGDARALLSDLCWLGSGAVRATSVRIADWGADPWARGGYAYLDPGFDPEWRALLSRRAGRIVFAGEHTSAKWQGYMNGAVESGEAAARKLLKDF